MITPRVVGTHHHQGDSVYFEDGSTAQALAGAVAAANVMPAHLTGRYYQSPLALALTTLVLVPNTLYAVPCFVPQPWVYDVAIEVTASAAGLAKVGIYAADATPGNGGVPTTLLTSPAVFDDLTELDISTTGVKESGFFWPGSGPSPTGWFWMVIVANAAATVRAISATAGAVIPWLGHSSGSNLTFWTGATGSHTYDSALPDPFPSPALVSAVLPRLLLKAL